MSNIQKLFLFIVYSNFLIAFAAVAQCLLTYVVLQERNNWFIIGIEGAATLLLYNFSLYLSKPKSPQTSPYERTRWVFGNMHVFWFNSIFAFALLFYSLWHVHLYTWLFLGIVGLVSLVYSLPVFRFRGRPGGLRQVPGLKLFHIALVWSLSSVGLPVMEMWATGGQVDWETANTLGLLKILFLLICTLPFDIRDMEQDSYYHLKTIPHFIGKRRAEVLCYLLIFFHVLLLWGAPYLCAVKVGMIITDLVIALMLHYLLFRKSAGYNHVYLIDFAMLLQYGCVLLFL